jgi:flagellar basal-body rod protein FlgF
MENSLTIALARQTVLTRQMDVIATNLANVNTAGFKAEQIIFTEQIQETAEGEFISIVHDVSFTRDLAEGPLTGTNAPLDLAIHGRGYFVVDTPDGTRYTRHGVFQVNADRQIVTTEGNTILNTAGAPITIPEGTANLVVARDGTVSADTQEIGKVQIVRFADEQALVKIGSGLYDAETQTAEPTTESEILQGTVENSNVSGVTEITRMIDTVRAYQAAAKLVDTEHQLILNAIDALMSSA